MEREARGAATVGGSGGSRSEIISRSRPKQQPRQFRRTTPRSPSAGMSVREPALALALGFCTTVCVLLWMRTVASTHALVLHSLAGASAALVLAPAGALSWRLERWVGRRIRWIHGATMAGGFITLNAAVGVAFKMRFDAGGPHFYSLHSWMGVMSLVLAKMAFADAAASHLAAACGVRTLYGFKVPAFDHVRHIAAASTASAAATTAVVLGLQTMQYRLNSQAKAGSPLRPLSVASNFLALGAIATAVMVVLAVRKRRRAMQRERDAALKLQALDDASPRASSSQLGV